MSWAFSIALWWCIIAWWNDDMQAVAESFHGGTLLAMAGRDAVVIAADSRFSSHETGAFMLGQFPRSIYRIGSRTLVGFYGIDSDARTIMERIREKLSKHQDHHLQPNNLARVLSDTLYASGLICSPILVGMQDDGHPFICSMDSLGAQTVTDSFAVAGTANSGLYALCESAYRPELSADELVDVVERCLRLALQRDTLSGGNLRLYTLLPNGDMFLKEIQVNDV